MFISLIIGSSLYLFIILNCLPYCACDVTTNSTFPPIPKLDLQMFSKDVFAFRLIGFMSNAYRINSINVDFPAPLPPIIVLRFGDKSNERLSKYPIEIFISLIEECGYLLLMSKFNLTLALGSLKANLKLSKLSFDILIKQLAVSKSKSSGLLTSLALIRAKGVCF